VSYKESQDECLEYVRLNSPDVRRRLKVFLNQAVKKFLDIRYWEKCLYTQDLTIDGSGSYDLSTSLTPAIYKFKNLYVKDNTTTFTDNSGLTETWTNVGIQNYNRASDKTRIYAIEKDILYVNGTGFDVTVEYLSAGTGYPMSADADDPAVLQNYAEILEKWACVLFFRYWGDLDIFQYENQELQDLLRLKKRDEAREAKRGRMVRVSSHARVI